MLTFHVLFWLELAFLHKRVDGLPATFPIDASWDKRNLGAESAKHRQRPWADVNFGRDLELRSDSPPKKGGRPPKAFVVVPFPRIPVIKGIVQPNAPSPPSNSKDGKGKIGSPSSLGGDGTTPLPQTPAPSKSGQDRLYHLGECGSELLGDPIRNVDSNGRSPPRKPKTPKPPKTPKAPRLRNRPDNDDEDEDIKPQVSGVKKMQVCGVKVDMIFPDYPSSGDAIVDNPGFWGKSLVAYNAEDSNPCKNDYRFGKRPYPVKQTSGVYTPDKPEKKNKPPHTKDIWQTEHVMDAQIMKLFFQDMFQDIPAQKTTKAKAEIPRRDADIKRDEIPASWVSSLKGKAAAQDQCSYLEQFWTKRWPKKQESAMTQLLKVFPGVDEYTGEMLLLPGRLNNKKASLFSIKGYNVVSPLDFPNFSLHRKIDELREIILLIEYLNTPDVAKYFKALAVRIRDELAKIDADGATAFMRKTDDWWYKQKPEPELKDTNGQKYKSVGLASRWPKWINTFVKERTTAMQNLLIELFHDLDTDWEDAKTYAELQSGKGKAYKEDFEVRMKALRANINKSVKVQAYVIGSLSQPNTPSVSDSEPGSESDGTSDSDTGPETPTKSRPGQGQSIPLPHRPAPPKVAGSTPVPKSRKV